MPDKNDTTSKASIPFRTIAHFFDADDPSPEERRELSGRAEDRIFRDVIHAAKGPGKTFVSQLEISLPGAELTPGRQAAVAAAIRSHFRVRSEEVQRDMHITERLGLREFRLTVAVCIPSFIGIAICSQFKGNPVAEVIDNVLIIFCWVTIWQPFQSLVFDRWTQAETAKIYQRIAEMDIRVRPA